MGEGDTSWLQHSIEKMPGVPVEILSAASDAMFLFDSYGRIVWTTAAFAKLTGYSANNMSGNAHCGLFGSNACFVLLTASGAPETISIAAQLHVSGYLRKPATPHKIRAAISKARSRAIRLNRSKYSQLVIADA